MTIFIDVWGVSARRDYISNHWRSFVFPIGAPSAREICDSCRILDFFPDKDFSLIQVDPDKLEKINLHNKKMSSVLSVEIGSIRDASLSPDGEWVSYLKAEPDGRASIWITPIGENPVSTKKTILITEDNRYISPPEWSLNGHNLDFLSQQNDR